MSKKRSFVQPVPPAPGRARVDSSDVEKSDNVNVDRRPQNKKNSK